jgi:hypothetical protein
LVFAFKTGGKKLIDIIREILDNYNKEIVKDFDLADKIFSAVEAAKNKIDKILNKEALNEEEEEYKKLAKKYRDAELAGNLLFMDYKGWKILPIKNKEIIKSKFSPFLFNGACLDFIEVHPYLYEVFGDLRKNGIIVILAKLSFYYKLFIIDYKNISIINSRMSVSDINEFNDYIFNNIIWSNTNEK